MENIRSSNISWHQTGISDSDRRRITGTAPQVLWLTGLSGSGKSTIGAELETMLIRDGYSAYMLDGDNLRHGLCSNLGFSEEDRNENIRRISEAARLVALSGNIVIVCVISPSEKSREDARKTITSDGKCDGKCSFDEVYISTPVSECSKRDPKGLYKKAMSGEIKNFTGIDAPYDIPKSPDVEINTTGLTPAECAKILFDKAVGYQTNYNEIVRTSVEAAVEAGKKILEIYQRDFKVEYKDDKSPLTEADIASGKIITDILRERFPYIDILSEEEADICDENGVMPRLSNRYCFIVDPIDGTKEFIKKNGEFTISIGFSNNHSASAGVIYVPVSDTVYMAAKNHGAYKIVKASEKISEIKSCESIFLIGEKIHVSERTESLVVVASRSHPDEQTAKMLANTENANKIAETISAGSCLKGCMIAEGTADVHYRFGAFTKEWDIAAMDIICTEAGAVFKSGDGRKMLYNRTNTVNEKGFYILNKQQNAMKIDTED